MTLANNKEIIEKIKMENEEFRTLSEEHRALEKRLEEMDKRPYLTTDEEIERKKIQKLKLLNKDRMARILYQYEHR